MKNAILIVVVEKVERAQDTGKPGIFSKTPTKSYSDGWDAIWGKTKTDGLITEPDKSKVN